MSRDDLTGKFEYQNHAINEDYHLSLAFICMKEICIGGRYDCIHTFIYGYEASSCCRSDLGVINTLCSEIITGCQR